MPDGSQSILMQRARGLARVRFDGPENRLTTLHQSGCLKAKLPRNHAPEPDVVLINTAGGLTGGDVLSVDITAEDGARVNVATQTAERVYKSSAFAGQVNLRLKIGAQASIHWMPQETILFDHSSLARTIVVDMAEDSELLIIEPMVFGRRAMGERLSSFSISDQWRIRRSSTLVHAEATRFSGSMDALSGPAALGDTCAVATIVFVSSTAESRLEQARALVPDTVSAGFSADNGRLIGRFAGTDPRLLRDALIQFLTAFRAAPMPRVWTM